MFPTENSWRLILADGAATPRPLSCSIRRKNRSQDPNCSEVLRSCLNISRKIPNPIESFHLSEPFLTRTSPAATEAIKDDHRAQRKYRDQQADPQRAAVSGELSGDPWENCSTQP